MAVDTGRAAARRLRGDGRWAPAWMSAVLAIVVVASFAVGRYWVPPGTVLEILGGQVLPIGGGVQRTMETVVTEVRLPRIAGAVLIGAALAILLKLPWAAVQLLAFAFGLLAAGASVLIGRTLGRGSLVVLVLGGLVVSALFQALISTTQYLANPDDTLPAITFWLMGGLGRIRLDDLLVPGAIIAICRLALYLLRWPINVLAAGEDEAWTLGVDRRLVWSVVICAATLMTTSAVSLAGIIGWVGLIVPHAARFIVGPSFDRLLPAAILLGAGFLLVVDDIARSATTMEIPLGILTALIGAPCFIVLLAKARGQWQ